MKKILLASIFIVSFFFQTNVQAQVPNGGFENWTSTSYRNPTGWSTGNGKSIRRMGVAPITRVTGFAGYAVRLQTIISGSDTSDSYIANTYGDPLSGEGGVPFAEMPIGIKAKYRCNLPGVDSAIILVIFKHTGTIISSNIFKLGGVISTFTNFTFPLSLPSTPDSVIVAFASSDLISGTGIQNGSFLELDNFVFTGATTLIPNNDFETWDSLHYDVPIGWETNGDSISKTTDHHSGSYAIRMVTQDYGGGNINAAYITTGHNTNFGTIGGLPFSSSVDTLCGYYKYTTSFSDSATINASLTHLGSIVGGNGHFLAPIGTYTYFEMPLSAGATPDTMRIDAASSKWPYTAFSAGSTLFLDRLALKSVLLNVENMNQSNASLISTFPNPAKDVLNFSFKKLPTSDFDLKVYNLLGGLVKSERYNYEAKNFQMNIADLAPGTYYFKGISKDDHFQSSFVKE